MCEKIEFFSVQKMNIDAATFIRDQLWFLK